MSSSREIKSKVQSVQNTQKITGAMELVARSKMKYSTDAMQRVRPYVDKANDIIKNFVSVSLEYPNPYIYKREVKRVGFIIISTDRGLCGGLNINLFKYILHEVEAYLDKKIEIDICVIGNKAAEFFKRLKGVNVVSVSNYVEKSEESMVSIYGAVSIMLDKFQEKNIDRFVMFGNKFVSTIKQKPNSQIILPLKGIFESECVKASSDGNKPHWDYIYERDIGEVLDALCMRYIESQIRGAILENAACEQAARMLAMKNATDNASDIIDSLNIEYNKVRQAMITQELAEICSGAAAV